MPNLDNHVSVVLTDTTPLSIKWMDASTNEVSLLPIHEALEKFHMHAWFHAFLVKADWALKITPSESSALSLYAKRSIETEEKMAIVAMPSGLPGNEAVAIEPISKNSMLFYSAMTLFSDEVNLDDNYILGHTESTCLTAKHYGNISRFFSHALDQKTMDNEVTFSSDALRARAATANFEVFPIKAGGDRLWGLRALRAVAVGERIVWNYGLSYFYHTRPVLFDTLTKGVIDRTLYYWSNPTIFIETHQEVFNSGVSLRNLIEQDSYILLTNNQTIVPYDIYIQAEFFETFLQENPRWLEDHSHDAQLTVLLPKEPHPAVKYITPGTDLSDFLLGGLNHLLGGVHRIKTWDETVILNFNGGIKRAGYMVCGSVDKIKHIKERLMRLNIACVFSVESPQTLYIAKRDLFKATRSESWLQSGSMFSMPRGSLQESNQLTPPCDTLAWPTTPNP